MGMSKTNPTLDHATKVAEDLVAKVIARRREIFYLPKEKTGEIWDAIEKILTKKYGFKLFHLTTPGDEDIVQIYAEDDLGFILLWQSPNDEVPKICRFYDTDGDWLDEEGPGCGFLLCYLLRYLAEEVEP